jgi:hypothetical protein
LLGVRDFLLGVAGALLTPFLAATRDIFVSGTFFCLDTDLAALADLTFLVFADALSL